MSNVSASDLMKKMKKIRFLTVFEETVNLVMKGPLHLLVIAAIPFVGLAAIETYVYPFLFEPLANLGAIFVVVGILLAMVIALSVAIATSGALIKALKQLENGEDIKFPVLIDFVKDNFRKSIDLSIEILKYTAGWILLAYALVIALLTQGLMYADGGAFAGVASLLTFLAGLFPIVMIVYLIFYFTKIVNSSFAWYVFWSAEKPRVDGAIKRSLEITDNMTWAIFANYILISLLAGLFSFLFLTILQPFFIPLGWMHGGGMQMWGGHTIAGAIINAVVCPFMLGFGYKLKLQAEKMKRV